MNDAQISAAIESLGAKIQAGGADKAMAECHFERGKLYWRLDRRADAISDYESAVQLDPASPAAAALAIARDVMNFYHRDLYNP